MLPSFLTLNAVSATARKSEPCSGSSSLENDVYGIFERNEARTNLRRSNRLSNKKTSKNSAALSNNLMDTSSLITCSLKSDFCENFYDKNIPEPKRKCKSLFKEINQRYAEIEGREPSKNFIFNTGTNNNLFPNNSPPNSCPSVFEIGNDDVWRVKNEPMTDNFFPGIKTENMSIFENGGLFLPFSRVNLQEYDVNSDFCTRLAHQLVDYNFKQVECNNKIIEAIQNIQINFSGDFFMNSEQTMGRFDTFHVNHDSPIEATFNFLPQTDWLYKTPTKMRNMRTETKKKNTMQPAIVYRDHNNCLTDVYEINPEDITVDLTKFKFQDSAPLEVSFLAHCFDPNVQMRQPQHLSSSSETCFFNFKPKVGKLF